MRTRRWALAPNVRELAWSQCSQEAPDVLLLFAVMSLISTIPLVLVDSEIGRTYALANVASCVVFAAAGVTIRKRLIPPRWSPTVTATAMTVAIAVLAYQASYIGPGAFAGMIMVIAITAAIVPTWPPYLLCSAAVVLLAAASQLSYGDQFDIDWIVLLPVAATSGAVVVWMRRRALVRLAVADAQITHLATHDLLTGLLNRHGLDSALPAVAALAQREARPLFAVFVDISRLKQANDSHGHLIGDLVIARTGAAVKEASRASDLVCRWGGDEFVVIGIGDRPDDLELRERITALIDSTGLEGKWTPGVGVGSSSRIDGNIDLLVQDADHAMYRTRQGE